MARRSPARSRRALAAAPGRSPSARRRRRTRPTARPLRPGSAPTPSLTAPAPGSTRTSPPRCRRPPLPSPRPRPDRLLLLHAASPATPRRRRRLRAAGPPARSTSTSSPAHAKTEPNRTNPPQLPCPAYPATQTKQSKSRVVAGKGRRQLRRIYLLYYCFLYLSHQTVQPSRIFQTMTCAYIAAAADAMLTGFILFLFFQNKK